MTRGREPLLRSKYARERWAGAGGAAFPVGPELQRELTRRAGLTISLLKGGECHRRRSFFTPVF
jgi:hypothetical protein